MSSVSIHATLAGGDLLTSRLDSSHPMFLSTPPSRVATQDASQAAGRQPGFYPRHPRGWRPGRRQDHQSRLEFLSTPPSRVATIEQDANSAIFVQFLSTPPSRVATTLLFLLIMSLLRVSIHATLAGGDSGISSGCACSSRFLSTPPSRVATPPGPHHP